MMVYIIMSSIDYEDATEVEAVYLDYNKAFAHAKELEAEIVKNRIDSRKIYILPEEVIE